MPVHFIDSEVFRGVVTTPEMRAIFEERRFFQRWLDVEAALAATQAELGLIPAAAAEAIAAQADAERLDFDRVVAHGRETGHSLVPVVRELRRLVGPEHERWVHWGATTQDIVDSGLMLMLKDAHGVVRGQLRGLLEALLPLLARHRETLMVGRTHGVHALPITFGFKAATWADELARHLERWDEVRARVLVGSINGAVGTMAAWGEHGFAVQEGTCRRLGLGVPDISWQSARDRTAELTNLCALLAGSLHRVAQEVYLLAKTEVREIEEPFRMGMVGSSTMPHKRNPVRTEWVMNLARIVRHNAGTMLEAMASEHERDASRWRTEWIVLPETFAMLSAALAHLHETLAGLQVHAERMERNTHALGGLLLSESVMFVVARAVGLAEAHEQVYRAAMRAYETERPLREVLLEDPALAAALGPAELDAALEPRHYTGLAASLADRVHARVTALLERTPGP